MIDKSSGDRREMVKKVTATKLTRKRWRWMRFERRLQIVTALVTLGAVTYFSW